MISAIILYSILSSSVFTISVGTWLWWRNKKSPLNIVFFLISISLTGLLFGSYMLFKKCGIDEGRAILWGKISYFSFIPFFALIYHFVLILTDNVRKKRKTILLGYIIALLFMGMVWTNLFTKGVFYYRWGCNLIAQTGYHVWFIIMAIYFILSFYNLFRYLLKGKNLPNKKQAILTVGILILSILSLSKMLPSYKIEIYPLSFIGWWLIAFVMDYIIVSYYLDIKAVITEALIVMILIALFTETITSESSKELIERIFFFIVVAVLGQSVIRSVESESRQGEILERTVEKRTRELRKSYDEIKQKKDDLEHFYKLTVGRELKMVELKKQIKKLKEKLEKYSNEEH